MKANLITIFLGVFIAVASWVPLWIVEARDRHAMPVGRCIGADVLWTLNGRF